MTRVLAYGALAVAMSCVGSHRDAEPSPPPNVVVFLVDDMGWQDTSVAFHTSRTALNERYRTPNMERLAKSGVKFTQAYAYAVCSPSRVSLMTGLSASRHRVTNWTLRKDRMPDRQSLAVRPPDWNVNGLSPDPSVARTVSAPTLPSLLRRAGYATIHCGKAHFGARGTPGAEPRNLGFDVNIGGHAAGGPGSYHGERNYSAVWRNGSAIWDVPGLEKYHGTDTNLTEALTREAIAAIDDVRRHGGKHKPFFLYMSHYAVHAPFEPDSRFIERYRNQGLKKTAANFASLVESMDRSLGDLLDYLERNNLVDNTVVLFLSDNGSPPQTPRNLPLRGHKLMPYEGGVRVPLLVRWPGVSEAGRTCATPVHIDDVFATVLDIAQVSNLDRPAGDGFSFADAIRGDSREPHDRAFFWHYPNTYYVTPYTAMRYRQWKLIYHHVDRKLELFDLDADLGETNDLSERRPELLRKLAKRMADHLLETDALMPFDKQAGRLVELPTR